MRVSEIWVEPSKNKDGSETGDMFLVCGLFLVDFRGG